MLSEHRLSSLRLFCPQSGRQRTTASRNSCSTFSLTQKCNWLQRAVRSVSSSSSQTQAERVIVGAALPEVAASTAEVLTVTVGGREITLESGEIGRQANGAVLIRDGDTVLYTTACCDGDAADVGGFAPFSVTYNERFSAVGRTSGSFFRREGRLKTNEMITSRLTDRPLRPMMPKGWTVETQVLTWLMSYDGTTQPEPLAITSAGAALAISDIPLSKAVAGVRVGLLNGTDFVLNPTVDQQAQSTLDLVVAGTADAVLMIEGFADFLTEEQMLQALRVGSEAISHLCREIQAWADRIGKPKRTDLAVADPAFDAEVAKSSFAAEMKEVYRRQLGKQQRMEALSELKCRAIESLAASTSTSGQEAAPRAEKDVQRLLRQAMSRLEANIMRSLILDEGIRADGRSLTEVRPIISRCGLLPRTHGSSLFTRGETQAIVVTTLGGSDMAMRQDNVASDVEGARRFYLQYNFPPSCVGETGRVGSPGRREIGHGMLAERALQPIIPEEVDFPYTIRVESTITESNGSSSMASVCGGCLSLQDAGVPIRRPVAGVAMGLVLSEDGRYKVLTDILGTEDALGDMDFKVAGDVDGITAFQMDIKVEGISLEIMTEALAQAKEGRKHVLQEMQKCSPPPFGALGPQTPKILRVKVDPSQVGMVIGAGGKTIRAIREESRASIQLINDGAGNVFELVSDDEDEVQLAKSMILAMVEEPEIGKTYSGAKVTGVEKFGLFIEFLPNRQGLLHVSELAGDEEVDDFDLHDEIDVVLLWSDGQKFKLSRAALPGMASKSKASSARPSTEIVPPGTIFRHAEVKDVKPYGVFVEVQPGYSGLVHTSELWLDSESRIPPAVGDHIPVVVLEPRDDGRPRFSRKQALDDGVVAAAA